MRNIHDLRLILFEMHQRDVKRILVSILIMEGLAILAVAGILSWAFFIADITSLWMLAGMALLLVIPSFPLVVELYTTTRRPAMLMRFLEEVKGGAEILRVRINNGNIISGLMKRIYGPLLSVVHVHVTFLHSDGSYILPLSEEHIQPLVILLSSSRSLSERFTGIGWSSN